MISNLSTTSRIKVSNLDLDKNDTYFKLEDLEVTPNAEEQNFKSDKYGYNNVTVKAIETEEITIQPGAEEQVKEGIFNKVTVLGDENLKPENIKKGTNIFGVEGIGNMTNVKITNANYLFYNGVRTEYMNELLSLCENVTASRDMFDASGLRNLDLSTFNTSNVTDMFRMFYNNTSLQTLNVSNFDTSNVTNMEQMFGSCSRLTELDVSSFDTSKVTDMSNMFSSCDDLINLDLSNFNTSNVTDMFGMLRYLDKITSLDLSNFDASKVKIIQSLLQSDEELVNLKFMTNLGKGYTSKSNNYSYYTLDLSASTKLIHDSLMSVINNLYDLNITYSLIGDGTLYTQQLVLGSTNLAKLSPEEITIATNRGWTVS